MLGLFIDLMFEDLTNSNIYFDHQEMCIEREREREREIGK